MPKRKSTKGKRSKKKHGKRRSTKGKRGGGRQRSRKGGLTGYIKSVARNSTAPRAFQYAKGHNQPFSDTIQMPTFVVKTGGFTITNPGGTVNLCGAFPAGVGTCIAAIPLNPISMSSVSMIKVRSATYRNFNMSDVRVQYDPALIPGNSSTPVNGQFYGFFDDNASAPYAVGQTVLIDQLRARRGGAFTESILERAVWTLPAGIGKRFKDYTIAASVDPNVSIKATFYMFQTMCPTATAITPCAQLTVSGMCHFSEDTFTAIPGSVDFLSTLTITTSPNTNYLGLPVITSAQTTASSVPTLPVGQGVAGSGVAANVSYVGSLGCGVYFNSGTSVDLTIVFPYIGNYTVTFNYSYPGGTGTSAGFGLVLVPANSTVPTVVLGGGPGQPTVAGGTLGGGSAINTFLVTATAPGQYASFDITNAPTGMSYGTVSSLLVSYLQSGLYNTNFSALQKTEELSDKEVENEAYRVDFQNFRASQRARLEADLIAKRTVAEMKSSGEPVVAREYKDEDPLANVTITEGGEVLTMPMFKAARLLDNGWTLLSRHKAAKPREITSLKASSHSTGI